MMLNSALRAIVATWLKEGMDEKGLNPTTLERQSGVTRDTIYRILKQETTAGEDTLQRLSDAIGRSIPDLTTAPEAPTSPVAPRSPAEPPSGGDALQRLLTLQKRLRLFRLQLAAYQEAGERPGPGVMAEWLELLADLEESRNGDGP